MVFAFGCGGEDLPQPIRMEAYITVIDDSGTEREIRYSELIDEKTGEPTAKQVLVVDQQSRKTLFLDVTELQEQSPSSGRYVPVTNARQATN